MAQSPGLDAFGLEANHHFVKQMGNDAADRIGSTTIHLERPFSSVVHRECDQKTLDSPGILARIGDEQTPAAPRVGLELTFDELDRSGVRFRCQQLVGDGAEPLDQ